MYRFTVLAKKYRYRLSAIFAAKMIADTAPDIADQHDRRYRYRSSQKIADSIGIGTDHRYLQPWWWQYERDERDRNSH